MIAPIPTSEISVRLMYEAFSAFSSALIKCQNIQQVEQCLGEHLKYIVNFDLFRLRFKGRQDEIVLLVSRTEGMTTCKLQLPKTAYEAGLKELHSQVTLGAGELNSQDEWISKQQRLWCWCFLSEAAWEYSQTTIVCNENVQYTKNDISFVRLVTETVLIKLKELSLIERLRRLSLSQARIIRQKTKELEEKNASLLALTMHHAHNIREPLTRIMGLINVVDWSASQDEVRTTYRYIGAAAEDLDQAIRRGVTTIEEAEQNIKRANGNKGGHRID